MSAEEDYDALVEAMTARPGVGCGRMFSSNGLHFRDKYFALLRKESLLLKLPEDRVDELVGIQRGERFEPSAGRVMREWILVPWKSGEDWTTLAQEALEFAQHLAGVA
ncbi:MAG TPA: hypothetical protein VGJ86_24255 [Acidimicrobiales bacterium]|jgi:hypothetical protein